MTGEYICAALLLLLVGGAGCFYAGYACAERKRLGREKKENEQVEKVLRSSATLTRDDCLRRLRGCK